MPDFGWACLNHLGWLMSDVWYYADGGGGQDGPFTFGELKAALASMSNPKDVLVWRDGFPDWMSAEDVPELSGSKSGPTTIAPQEQHNFRNET
jgi:hypothetical protein